MKRFLLIVLFAVVPFSVHAQDSFYLEELTWPEVKERMSHGTDTIIIPTGGTEQNGPHIAIGKHNWIVQYTSGEIARELGNALAAPVLAYVPEGPISPPQGHMLFPGTLSVTEEHFAAILEDAARSFKQEGFKHICFIGDHGGNQKAQSWVAEKLSDEWKNEGVTVLQVDHYYKDEEGAEWAKSKTLSPADPAAHAGFMDAAEVMAAHAGSVRKDKIQAYDKKDFPTTGVLGDPSGANAEIGKKLLAFKVRAAAEQIRKSQAPQ